jgi:hypothetical protein
MIAAAVLATDDSASLLRVYVQQLHLTCTCNGIDFFHSDHIYLYVHIYAVVWTCFDFIYIQTQATIALSQMDGSLGAIVHALDLYKVYKHLESLAVSPVHTHLETLVRSYCREQNSDILQTNLRLLWGHLLCHSGIYRTAGFET